jgi:hypothetical protein
MFTAAALRTRVGSSFLGGGGGAVLVWTGAESNALERSAAAALGLHVATSAGEHLAISALSQPWP